METKTIVPVRRLIYDIEVTPNVVLAFRAGYDLNINHESIIEERKVICIAYKWQGERNTTILRWDKNRQDRRMLLDFIAVAATADELVAHFGDRFDLPWIRTRCLILKLNPLPFFKTIDTKAWASKNFYFNSNKLDYISQILGFAGKEKMEFEDWKNIVTKNNFYQTSLDKMCFYCGEDVNRLEEVFLSFEPLIRPKTHVGVMNGLEKWTCPRTGSTNVITSKKRVTHSGTINWQMQNKDNGTYYQISEKAHNAYLKHVQTLRRPSKKGNGKG